MAGYALYFFDCRARETRMQLYRTFREPRLYRYAKRLEYDLIVERCRKSPLVAAREARFRHDYPPQQTALHLVLEPLFLIGNPAFFDKELREKRHLAAAALLEANKDAALVSCTLGTTPIIMVCVDPYASLKDVDMLVRARPRSLLLPDIEGRLPLHYACINNRANIDMVKQLIEACPEAAFVKDRLGRLALHYASMASPLSNHASSSGLDVLSDFLVEHSAMAPISSPSVVKVLIQANSKAVSVVDKDGMTPIHHLCQYMNSQVIVDLSTELIAVIELLVQADPLVIELSDNSGRTPFSNLMDWHERLRAGNHAIDGRQKQFDALERIMSTCDA